MEKILIFLSALLLMTGCGSAPKVESNTYTVYARYYTDGTVITEDGNIWDYSQDIISKKASYDNEPVFALFDDNETPDNIYDDEILGLVLDRETAIYDALEAQDFIVERNGNNLRIK